jgi:hypothetical protein
MTDERRTTQDRRSRPTPAISRYTFFGGRRRGIRRDEEARTAYVDQLGIGLSTILILIFLFHCLDAGFTLARIAAGARELNPIMAFLLSISPGAFLIVKLGMAGIGLCFLGIHKNFPLVKPGIAFLLVLYAGVIAYHIYLVIAA